MLTVEDLRSQEGGTKAERKSALADVWRYHVRRREERAWPSGFEDARPYARETLKYVPDEFRRIWTPGRGNAGEAATFGAVVGLPWPRKPSGRNRCGSRVGGFVS